MRAESNPIRIDFCTRAAVQPLWSMEAGQQAEEVTDILLDGINGLPGQLEEDSDIEHESSLVVHRNVDAPKRKKAGYWGHHSLEDQLHSRQSGREHYEEDVVSLDSLGFGPSDSDASSLNMSHKCMKRVAESEEEGIELREEQGEGEEEEASSDTPVVRKKRGSSFGSRGPGLFDFGSMLRKHEGDEHRRAPKRQAWSTFGSDTPTAFQLTLQLGSG